MKRLAALLYLIAVPLYCQNNSGELRLRVIDPAGAGIKASVQIVSRANQYQNALATNEHGDLDVQRLPYGTYQIDIRQPGFAPQSESIDIHSSLPNEFKIQLKIAALNQSVTVTALNTLVDAEAPGNVDQIGADAIKDRQGSIPGRDLQDLVNSQPGWMYEGNAVLHPRGSEYQTQFVVDGIPLTDNRSPSFGPEIEADAVQSMTIYTAGIPAEYGRKMGGIVEVNTLEDSQPGFRGEAVVSGGSYESGSAFAKAQYVWGKNTMDGSASGSTTQHYLNPVVPQNFSNTGTVGDFSVDYARDLTPRDRIKLIVMHELARYDIPNEMVQQMAGQRQNADNFETMGIVSYQHTFSAHAMADLHGMVRDNANDFYSNPESTPIEAFQHNWFREGYVKATATVDRGHHEWKAGVETDNLFLNEKLNYSITDPTQFDPGSAPTFAYQANRPDLEQAVFVEDMIRLHHWTIGAGLRWDHYQLLVNQEGLQPRVAISRYFHSADAVVHFSYDRVFQTPSFENILLSSTGAAASINPAGFLNLPVKPSQGDYYEAGVTKAFLSHFSIGANSFRRVVSNFADDSQIFNTTISFPIAFRKAILYGAEAKLDVPEWRHFSGYASYSYIVGNSWLPVTGGLFFGSDASTAASQLSGHFPGTQDQRNTFRGRVRYGMTSRLWFAFGAQYDSGVPFQFDGNPSTVVAQYGQQVLDRINFDRGRIDPTFLAAASVGADIYKSERVKMHLQIDGQNLTNVMDVLDFGGLFSGNAIGPSRSFSVRLATSF